MTGVRRSALAAAVAVVALLTLLVAGCSTVSGIVRAQRALTRAGYRAPSINYQVVNGGTVLRVRYRTGARDVAALAAEYADVARIAWQEAPLRFDAVKVAASGAPGPCVGDCVERFDRAVLEAQHGPRDPALDKNPDKELRGAGFLILAIIGVAVVLVTALLVRWRRRARRVQPWAAWPGQAGYPPGWSSPPGWSPPPGYPQKLAAPPPIAPTPHQAAPGFEPPPRGWSPPPVAWPPAAPAASPAGWPPATPPPAYERSPEQPTHDIWERPPS